MKTAIIGAGRNRNGIGPYIARYFQKNGARVVSVLGTTNESAQKAAAGLVPFGIDAVSYTDFWSMISREEPDAVVVASPVNSHYEYLLRCMEAGVHVFCEKPFVRPDPLFSPEDMILSLDRVFNRAEQQGLKVAMNSQWPFSLPYYEALCGPVKPRLRDTFFIRLSPIVSGKEMILDSVPHALSIVYWVFGDGDMDQMRLKAESEKKMTIRFRYLHAGGACAVKINLVQTARQPRDFSYGFNDQMVHRVLNPATYDISFACSKTIMRIEDPLDLSVRDFVAAVADHREPHIGKAHIMNNMKLLKEIYDFSQPV